MEKIKLLINGLVQDQSTEILIKTKVRAVASRLGFSEMKTNEIILACNEIMSNQIKYSIGAGMIQIWEQKSPFNCLDIFAFDMGPGIRNLNMAIKDGFSSSHTLGHGLGTIMRSSDIFEIYSKQKKLDRNDTWNGTAIFCRFFPTGQRNPIKNFQVGTFLRPLKDNVYNGDFINYHSDGSSIKWLHTDMLGHGKAASISGDIASEIVIESLSPEEIITTLNHSLSGKRMANGLAASLSDNGILTFSGYGDLSFKIISYENPRSIHLKNRTIGEIKEQIISKKIQVGKEETIITHSDGIVSRWNPKHFPGLFSKHPQLAAFLIGNLFERPNDDKSIFIVKACKEKENE